MTSFDYGLVGRVLVRAGFSYTVTSCSSYGGATVYDPRADEYLRFDSQETFNNWMYGTPVPAAGGEPFREHREELSKAKLHKPLTVLIPEGRVAREIAQADADVDAIASNAGTVLRMDAPEMYFHQLRLRVAEDPSLADKIVVLLVAADGTAREIGLTFESELKWPPGFCQEEWNIENAILKARQLRKEK